ncbi:hypothetical protein FRB90_004413 [Tulasnella sp. 427]|nr:hypothetical protein FRB90_004413 [Tulasnella sp. 427]
MRSIQPTQTKARRITPKKGQITVLNYKKARKPSLNKTESKETTPDPANKKHSRSKESSQVVSRDSGPKRKKLRVYSPPSSEAEETPHGLPDQDESVNHHRPANGTEEELEESGPHALVIKANPLSSSRESPDSDSRLSSRSASLRSSLNGNVSSVIPEVPQTPPSGTENEAYPTDESSDLRPEPFWIPFGHLQSLDNPKARHAFSLQNDARDSRRLVVGSNKGNCDVLVSGPDVGKVHCALTLRFEADKNKHLQRTVTAQRITTRVCPPNALTTIRVNHEDNKVGDETVLPSGATIQFGNGDRFAYIGPQFSDLYSVHDSLYGHDMVDANSVVQSVTRNHDQQSLVSKTIPADRVRMARKEIAAFHALGYHERLVHFVEAFCDYDSNQHHLIFEAGLQDLFKYTIEHRKDYQDWLITSAPIWITQITEGIAHLHGLGMSHRDLKPENILVVVSNFGRVTMKVMDLGLARLATEPVPEKWRYGTRKWKAPAAFRFGCKDDRPIDCYGVGRILYFLLTESTWPEEESVDPTKICACAKTCEDACVKRHAAFEVIESVASPACIEFLKKLLVSVPGECMTVSEMLSHEYLVSGF